LSTIYVLCETIYFCDIALELAWSSCFHGSAFDYYSMASLKHLLMSFEPSHSYCLTHTICLWEKNSKVCLNKDWLSSTVSIASSGISTHSVIESAMLSVFTPCSLSFLSLPFADREVGNGKVLSATLNRSGVHICGGLYHCVDSELYFISCARISTLFLRRV